MALRLFRTTGYSTLLMPGEARLALHPAWLVLAASLWLAVVCNVGVWRLPFQPDQARTVLGTIAVVGGASGVLLSLLGWRRTLKLAVTLLVFGGALIACGLWVQQLPLETLWQQQRPRSLLPGWASFMRWQVTAMMLVLGVVPVVWVWNIPVRRLPGPAQLQSNILGALLAALVFGGGLFLLR
jgi:glucan phosphoethanolaminetransferase (alkaline phosphatase superfamily)